MTSLQSEIEAYKEVFKLKAPEEKQRIMQQATDELEKSGIAQGLTAGEVAPDFTLPDSTGKEVSLSDQLKKGLLF